jgi:hypothetical protein
VVPHHQHEKRQSYMSFIIKEIGVAAPRYTEPDWDGQTKYHIVSLDGPALDRRTR